jgi:sigma-B regulation protein RsbU (phosphoserine phosphatase)
MAKRDSRTPEMKIKALEMELADRERELQGFKKELAQINQQLERFINQIAGELKMAGVIQRSLVPTDIPAIPGFEFSTKFVASPLNGGDYFDIFEMQDKMQFGILMSNSSGHGMASLFMSILLKLTTQIEAKKGMEPDEVLKHMSKEIQNNLQGEDLARIFYIVVDRRRYNLTYAKAGDVFAYLYKYSEDKLVTLDKGSPAIGKKTGLTYKSETIKLDPRDRLVLVSQGLINAVNVSQEKYGEDRLHEVILKKARSGCHELRNEILFQVSQFAEGRDYPNDLSVIIMEVKDKVISLKKG